MSKIDISREALFDLYCSKKLNAYEISKKLNVGSTTIYRFLKKYSIKTRTASECHIKYRRTSFSRNEAEKAYLIGFRLGDLYVRKAVNTKGCKTIRIEAHTTKPNQIKLFNFLFNKYGHVHIKKILSKGVKTIRGLCFLDDSFSFLLPKKDKIEDWILNDISLFLSFVSGYIDAEGNISINSSSGRPQLAIQTQDEKIIKSIHLGYRKYGFHSPKPIIARKAGYFSKGYQDRKSNKDHWSVAIYKIDSLRKILEKLELKHPKRKSDAQKVLKYINEKWKIK